MKVLIVEDAKDCAFLLTEIVKYTTPTAQVKYAATDTEALPLIAWSDLVITDFNFPVTGFPAILPTLQRHNKPFILQTSYHGYINNYDLHLQIASIEKGENFLAKMTSCLSDFSQRLNSKAL